ncbi:thiol:disulfide interchange protein DsbA/DsbL [Nitrogeniibacter mangrovi]|uniref:Thiol:disulfide interchange protein DsbA n=1 Tax=Nitrogeniibacter mangrovi TaxID=2016596 RepID=A0A6C1AYW0_9RHOO|nr:thiol:disulfide interchange protein DsbA/DsbL [Nitrogeniibacter mangrovi]QID16542.1 thiol:disulfide interchange protein DsbA/DsbL [Nitrogeniibacter mangrovi]
MNRRLALKQLAAVAGLSAIGLPVRAQSAGTFAPVNPPQPTDDPSRIEVLEFFHYGCPHCRAFDPLVSAWVAKQQPDVAFVRVPAIWGNPKLRGLAQFYYAMEAIDVADKLHPKVFEAYQDQHVPLETEAGAADWVGSMGVDRKKFLDAYKSFGVSGQVRRADQLARNYRIRGVPTLAIDGRFETSGSMAGSHEASLEVADELIARVRASRAKR